MSWMTERLGALNPLQIDLGKHVLVRVYPPCNLMAMSVQRPLRLNLRRKKNSAVYSRWTYLYIQYLLATDSTGRHACRTSYDEGFKSAQDWFMVVVAATCGQGLGSEPEVFL